MAEPHENHDITGPAKPAEFSDWNPSVRELIEAVKDEDHPHHTEAVKRNQEIAERMKPLLASIKPPTVTFPESISRLISDSAAASIAKSAADFSRQIDMTEQVKNTLASQLHVSQPVLHAQVPNMDDYAASIEEALEEKRQAEEERIEREEKSIELLQAMTAQITESNRQISQLSAGLEKINSSLQESDESAASAHKSAMCVGWLTFTVSALTLIASIVFFMFGD